MLPPSRAWAQTNPPGDELNAYRLCAARLLAEQAEMWDATLRPSEERHAFAAEMAEEVGQKVEDVERALTLDALASFDQERENLLAAVDWAYNTEDWEVVTELFENLCNYFKIWSFWADWEQVGKKAVEAGKRWGESKEAKSALSASLGNLGNSYLHQGRWDEAIEKLKQALRILNSLGDRHGEGQALGSLGTVYRLQSHWDEAIEKYEEALDIFCSLGYRYEESQTLNNLGNVYFQQGHWEEAIEKYEGSLRAKREIGDRYGEGQTLNNLGSVYRLQGHWEDAVEKYEEALGICRSLGDRYGESQTLNNLGNVYFQQGRWREAIEKFEESLRIKQDIGDRYGEGTSLNNLGSVYAQKGHWDAAIERFRKSLCIRQELGDRHGEASTLGNLGELQRACGNFPEALAMYKRVLTICEEIGDTTGIAKCHRRMAYFTFKLGDWKSCLNYLVQALSMALQLQPKLALDAIGSIVGIIKELEGEGRFAEVAELGDKLFNLVVEMEKEEWRSEELRDSGVLSRRVCAVITPVGKSQLERVSEEERAEARETALEMANAVDEVTDSKWGLEEWVRETTTD